MNKILALLSLLAISFWAITATVSAQEQSSSTPTATATTSEVENVDLGVQNPGILPSSPFYFMKEWRRSITKLFTTDPVKKAELELNEANERAAEIQKMEETTPSKIEAIAKAADNYQQNMERLKNHLEQLKETSNNPNIDKLVNNLIDRVITHNELFDNLKDKFQGQTDLKNKLEAGQEKISEVISEIPQRLENINEFKQKLLDKIQSLPDNPLKEVRAVEMLNKIEQRLQDQSEQKGKIQEIKDNLIQKVENKLNELQDLKSNITATSTTTTNLKQEIQQRIQEIQGKIKTCTQEAKICPDGSGVGRTGPNCEFAPCPTATNSVQQ